MFQTEWVEQKEVKETKATETSTSSSILAGWLLSLESVEAAVPQPKAKHNLISNSPPQSSFRIVQPAGTVAQPVAQDKAAGAQGQPALH